MASFSRISFKIEAPIGPNPILDSTNFLFHNCLRSKGLNPRPERKISASESLSVLEIVITFNHPCLLCAAFDSCRSVPLHA